MEAPAAVVRGRGGRDFAIPLYGGAGPARAPAALGETVKLLGSAQFKRDLEGVEDAAPLLAELGAALKTERRELTERRDLLAKDVSSLTDALAALGRQLE